MLSFNDTELLARLSRVFLTLFGSLTLNIQSLSAYDIAILDIVIAKSSFGIELLRVSKADFVRRKVIVRLSFC